MQTLTLAISPCPNDTFIFDAMLHHKIDTEDLDFNLVFADVEQLQGKPIITGEDMVLFNMTGVNLSNKILKIISRLFFIVCLVFY